MGDSNYRGKNSLVFGAQGNRFTRGFAIYVATLSLGLRFLAYWNAPTQLVPRGRPHLLRANPCQLSCRSFRDASGFLPPRCVGGFRSVMGAQLALLIDGSPASPNCFRRSLVVGPPCGGAETKESAPERPHRGGPRLVTRLRGGCAWRASSQSKQGGGGPNGP